MFLPRRRQVWFPLYVHLNFIICLPSLRVTFLCSSEQKWTYGIKQMLTHSVCLVTYWSKGLSYRLTKSDLTPAFDSHLPRHKGRIPWIYAQFTFYPNKLVILFYDQLDDSTRHKKNLKYTLKKSQILPGYNLTLKPFPSHNTWVWGVFWIWWSNVQGSSCRMD